MSRLVEPLNDAEREAFIAAALSLQGVRFRHTGRTLRGVDCVGLVKFALEATGRKVADRTDYGRNPVRDGLRDVLVAHFGDPVPRDSMQPGDVPLMRWHRNGTVDLFNHVGVLTAYPYGGLAIVHAVAESGRVVWHRLSDPWPRRIVEVYRP